MTARRAITWALIAGLIGAAGWRIWKSSHSSQATQKAPAGRLKVTWRGHETGNAELPVEMTWCPVDRTARLWAVSQDTGVVILMYEPDTLHLVTHRVIPYGIPVPPRPSAVLGFRVTGDTSVAGYNSTIGTVELKGSSQSVSGTFTASMHRVGSADTVSLTGSFAGVPTVTRTAGCP